MPLQFFPSGGASNNGDGSVAWPAVDQNSSHTIQVRCIALKGAIDSLRTPETADVDALKIFTAGRKLFENAASRKYDQQHGSSPDDQIGFVIVTLTDLRAAR